MASIHVWMFVVILILLTARLIESKGGGGRGGRGGGRAFSKTVWRGMAGHYNSFHSAGTRFSLLPASVVLPLALNMRLSIVVYLLQH